MDRQTATRRSEAARKSTETAGVFLMLSAILHLIGSAMTGAQGVGAFLLFPAVLYTALFFGLRRGLPWVAWLTLICMLGGMAGTLIELSKASLVPAWILWSIVMADLVCAGFLVRALWKTRRTSWSETSV